MNERSKGWMHGITSERSIGWEKRREGGKDGRRKGWKKERMEGGND